MKNDTVILCNPNDAADCARAGRVCLQKNDEVNAKKYLKRSLKLKEDLSVYEDLIRLYYKSGEYEKAARTLMACEQKYPQGKTVFHKNKLLNTIEILRGKIKILSKPTSLRIPLTSRCNIDCIMCGYNNKVWDMPEPRVREISQLLPYLKHIQWYGGEVFLSKYFKDLFEQASRYPYINQRIDTNGLLLNEKWIEMLVSAGVGLDISIDSTKKDTYEYIRAGGKFETLVRNLSLLKACRERIRTERSRNTHVSMSYIVMKSNYREMETIVDFARKYGFDNIQLNPLLRCNGKEDAYKRETVEDSRDIVEYLKMTVPEIAKEAGKYGVSVLDRLPYGKEMQGSTKLENNLNEKTLCHMPWKQLCINPDGTITPHCYCTMPLGDVWNNSLNQLWNSTMLRNYRKLLLRGVNPLFCSQVCLTNKMKYLEVDLF